MIMLYCLYYVKTSIKIDKFSVKVAGRVFDKNVSECQIVNCCGVVSVSVRHPFSALISRREMIGRHDWWNLGSDEI